MNEQPEALRLADDLDAEFVQGRISNHSGRKAATELRRLHAENEALRNQKLQAIADQADQMDADEALLRQVENDLHMVRGGYGKVLHENDKRRLDKSIAAIKERLK